jgi:BASS family bile acid:Na+ symporter
MIRRCAELGFVPAIVLGLLLGILVPGAESLIPLIPFLLASIIFLASFRVDFSILARYLGDLRYFGVRLLLVKLALPLLIFYLLSFISPELALGGLLLSALPSGLINVALSDVLKGNNELALAFTVASHLLSLISIPALVFIATRETVSMDYAALFMSLLQIVLIPILLATAIKRYLWKKLEHASTYFGVPTVFLVFSVVFIIVSDNRGSFLEVLTFINAVVFVLFLIVGLMAFGLLLSRDRRDRISLSLSTFHKNNGLALYLASAFFSQDIVILTIAMMLIISPSLAFFTWAVPRFLKE